MAKYIQIKVVERNGYPFSIFNNEIRNKLIKTMEGEIENGII